MLETIDWAVLFAMGGHGKYIWSAFGFSGILFIGLAVHAVLQFKKTEKALKRQYQSNN